jgi:hypothetical protein
MSTLKSHTGPLTYSFGSIKNKTNTQVALTNNINNIAIENYLTIDNSRIIMKRTTNILPQPARAILRK